MLQHRLSQRQFRCRAAHVTSVSFLVVMISFILLLLPLVTSSENEGEKTERFDSQQTSPPQAAAEMEGDHGNNNDVSGIHVDHRDLKVGGFRAPWLQKYHERPIDKGSGSASKFVSNSTIFNVTLNTFSKVFVKPYTSATELKEDLTAVMLLFANTIISGLLRFPTLAPVSFEDGPDPPSAEGETDFETNNQEEGVDEADTVKSDGRYVYTIYGDTIAVWEALSGRMVSNVTMLPVPGRSYRTRIRALLLTASRLTAITAGPRNADLQFGLGTHSTRVIVYSTESLSSTGELVKLREHDLRGRYRDARSIGDVIHIVSSASFDVVPTILPRLHRGHVQFADLDDATYIQQAKLVAAREVVPIVVSGLMNAILQADGTLPKIARVGLWQEILSGYASVERSVYLDGPIVNTYTQVASFNASDDGISVALSGAFMPSTWGHTYATKNMLILAAEGYNWIESLNGGGESTYLLGFSINGTSVTPLAVGSVPGFILNQYSLDIYNGHLRVATTIRWYWTVSADSDGDDEFYPVWRWLGQNQVIILKIPILTDDDEPGLFVETGRIPNLGKELEVFTAVRFFDKVAYAVTFQITDPFYALNLSDPVKPMQLGELNITGFSSYLHSVNRNETMLVGVGQEADEIGRVLGVQVTLFDATDPTKPRVVQRYLVENDPSTWSSSTVRWDYKAFRWLSLGDALGLVILPLTVKSYQDPSQNFDGFVVLDVSPSGISRRFNITHAEGEGFFGCYYWASLTQRSLVFNGNATTLKGHSVLSTDLDTGELTWKLAMPKPANLMDCSNW